MGELRTITIRAEPVSHEAFAPFGVLPSDEGDEHDRADLEFTLDDGHVNFIAHTADEVPHTDAGAPRCELLNRHDTHTQTLMPVDVDGIVVVAPAALDFSDPAHLDEVRAFVLPRLAAVHLHRGTWHWGPYPRSGRSIRLFNVQGSGYRDDNGIAWLARDLGAAFAVV